MLCYSYERAATSLYNNVGNKCWACDATRSVPENAQSGQQSCTALKTFTANLT